MGKSRRFSAALFIITSAFLLGGMARPANGQTPEQAKLLESIKSKDQGQLAVSEEDGRFLRLMVASSGATRVLEIGGASGYSGIWIAMGLRSSSARNFCKRSW